jgi:hypothetical protein
MKKTFTILSIFISISLNAQWLGNLWTADDMNGNSHDISLHLNEGKTVLVDISAHWCGPCWSLHQSHSMAGVYHDFGPDGTNEVMVYFTDVDAGSSIPILQGGSGSQGDWITGTEYPIIGPNGQGAHVDGFYTTPGVPTLYLHCGSVAPEISTSYDWWSLFSTIKGSCPSAFTFSGADATLLKHDGVAGCPDGYTVEVDLYNASANTNLTSADIELRNPNGQLIATENWTGNISPLNRTSVTINHIVTTAGIYSAKVVNPNGVADTRPNGDEEDIFVDFGYSNAYWATPIQISVSGSNTTSWYLKQNSTNGIVASGFGGATNYPANISANECYTLLVLSGEDETYSITDGATNTVVQGTISGLEYKANFSAGNDPWTSLENIPNSISVYPIPTKDILHVEGDYDSFKITDILGKIVLQSENVKSVNVSHLNIGVYLLEIKSGDKSYSQKVQITR